MKLTGKTTLKMKGVANALTAASMRRRQEQLKQEKLALQATKPRAMPVALPPGTTKLTVNMKGNRRGLNMQENPPTSEAMKAKRAMRKLWNRAMPVLSCSNCTVSAQCPSYKAGYECAFLPFLHSHKIESTEDLLVYSKELLQQNIRRMQQAMIVETLQGGQPGLEVSESINGLFLQLMQLHERMTEETTLELETTEGSVIAQVFGSLDSLVAHTDETNQQAIDIPIQHNDVEEQLAAGTVSEGIDPELVKDLVVVKGRGLLNSAQSAPAPTSQVHDL